MVEVETVDVLTGDHIDLRVPVTIEFVELIDLLLLRICQLGKVFVYNVFCRHVCKVTVKYCNFAPKR